MPIKLTNQQYKQVCGSLEDLQAMKEDIERAKRSGNPKVAALERRYEYCLERMTQIKKEYFPERK